MVIKFFNTLSVKVENFEHEVSKEVKIYSCGPTVYDIAHIGNLSNAVFVDILRRSLKFFGYKVAHTMNFTDFGHLTSDADEGEDKMAVGLKRDGLTPTMENMLAMGKKYANAFLDDIKSLGVSTDEMRFVYASEYIDAQIALIKTLEEKGYAYQLPDGLYFETEKFKNYGALGKVNEVAQEAGKRIENQSAKKNPRDFSLWKLNENIGWNSPWGKGFPGWHIECSAMALATLGKQIDIHTGGIEHIGTHHNNEIAQSEAATGKQFSKIWMHRSHIGIESKKISKSIGNTIYLRHIIERGFSPLDYRYWLLTAHYRTQASFIWEALQAAATARARFCRARAEEQGEVNKNYLNKFSLALANDLDTPRALATLWEVSKDESLTPKDRWTTIKYFDSVLNLGLSEITSQATSGKKISVDAIPPEVQMIKEKRDKARSTNDYITADALRSILLLRGYDVFDNGETSILKKKN